MNEKEEKGLSRCEQETLIAIYSDDGVAPDLATVRDKVNAKGNHTWAPQTVSTFIARLVRKGYLTMYRKGRYSYYTPTISIEQYRREKLLEMKRQLFNDSKELMEQYLKEL